MPTTNHPIVGTVRWNPVSPGAGGGPIQLLDQWEQTHIVTVPVPAL